MKYGLENAFWVRILYTSFGAPTYCFSVEGTVNDVDIGASGAIDAGPQSKICSKGSVKSDSEYILSELRLSIVMGGTYGCLLYPRRGEMKWPAHGRNLVSYI